MPICRNPTQGMRPRHETVSLWQGRERIRHLAVNQSKISRIFRNIDDTQGIERAIEEFGCPQLEQTLLFAMFAHSVNHMVSLLPGRHHVGDHFGRVLQIAVNQDHSLAARVFDTRRNGHLMSKIAGKAQHPARCHPCPPVPQAMTARRRNCRHPQRASS